MSNLDEIRERLKEVRPTGARGNVLELGMVQGLKYEGGRVTLELSAGGLPPGLRQGLVEEIRRVVGSLPDVEGVDVSVAAATPAPQASPLPGVAHIIAVASTKGGVGKSTVAANLACALAATERSVGLLDVDVYGPSVPTMMGTSARPRVVEKTKIYPVERYGLKLMSMGFFLDENTPVIWRGPLVTGLIRQFLKDVRWGDLDVLVIDLPPGTGDAQLTLVQQVPISGALIVTTPQLVSLVDVERGVAMFREVNTPVFGVVENMSAYVCSECGKEEHLFGTGAGDRIAHDFNVPMLARIPLVEDLRRCGDDGRPIVVDQPRHAVSQVFVNLADAVGRCIDQENLAAVTPTIVG